MKSICIHTYIDRDILQFTSLRKRPEPFNLLPQALLSQTWSQSEGSKCWARTYERNHLGLDAFHTFCRRLTMDSMHQMALFLWKWPTHPSCEEPIGSIWKKEACSTKATIFPLALAQQWCQTAFYSLQHFLAAATGCSDYLWGFESHFWG